MAKKLIKPQTLKGFRDFLPEEVIIRQKTIDVLKNVFESYGFEPLETPSLEYAETLLGKYGEEADKLIYQFIDRGGRNVGLRYDLTVPLARVIASNPNLAMPFKRYQIQPVWRAEKPQAGRFREFLQCDADIVGSKSTLADAEVIILAAKSLEKLGFKNFSILINDRQELFRVLAGANVSKDKRLSVTRSIDKWEKIKKDGVKKELIKKDIPIGQVGEIIKRVQNARPSKELNQIFSNLKTLGLSESRKVFSPTLARGLDYYTGMIFEIRIGGYPGGSIAGGGRYDMLIGFAAMRDVPAVGFSFGLDRLVEAVEQQGLFEGTSKSATEVLVTIFLPKYLQKSIEITNQLRESGINTELYLDPQAKLDKQLKYADRKGIPYVVIIGPEEVKENKLTLKNLKTSHQETLSFDQLVKKLQVVL